MSSVLLLCLLVGACGQPNVATSVHSLEADPHEDGVHEGSEPRVKAAERVSWHAAETAPDALRIKVLGFNDFHGQLSAGLTVGGRPVGSAAVLASYLHDAERRAQDGALIVHAGDHVGASPPASALLQDEPSISFLNTLANAHCRYGKPALPGALGHGLAQPLCNVVGTLGNHELDEGVTELLRLLHGGNHANGPFLEDPWRGTRVPYISANVVVDKTGETLLPPFTIKLIDDVPVAFIGAVLHEAPTIVTPSGVAGVRFLDEVTTINAAVLELTRTGVHAIVVAIHQGSRETSYAGPTSATLGLLDGPIADIVKHLDSEVDLVVSGHAHGFTNALVANQDGHPILVTQAFSASTAFGEIDLAIDRRSRDVVEKSAVITTTYADAGPGLTPDPDALAIVRAAERRVAPLVSRVVGTAANAITRDENASGESALGNLIADAQRSDTGAQFAFMNPGGIRADLPAGATTWGALFAIQPFSNELVAMDLTGAQIELLLERQWLGRTTPKILKTSGLHYVWDASAAVGSRVVEIRDANGVVLDPTATYRVVVNSFLASGGDGFVVLRDGRNRVVGNVDLAALVTYVGALPQPFSASIEGRIARLY